MSRSGAPTLTEPLPRRLPAHAERAADFGPAHLARPQQLNHRLQLIALALQRLLDRLQALQQTLGRQIVARGLGDLRLSAGNDLVAQRNALIANEDVSRSDNQRFHLVLRFEAERTVERAGRLRRPLRIGFAGSRSSRHGRYAMSGIS